MAQKPKLTLFVDIVSPFAYMAFYVLQRSQAFKQVEITYIPIFLGGVMKACDNRPPIQITNKAGYIESDRKRWSKYANIPMSKEMPKGFPPFTLHVMRALAVVEASQPDRLSESIAALYKAMWVDTKPIAEPAVFESVLAEVLGKEGAKTIVEQPEAKAKLQANTDLAFKEGAFGLPWFVATNKEGVTEKYWGFDHLGMVVEHLGLDRGQAPELKAML
ncbi:putative 2-hydroxychromene-2-carboxylate isomerase [Aureobasidium sp. EXF-3400]|nr:putative 2-hydroxychromene-2-carboxylate isomerase [Aureobasidium sp. EXF-12344]KAI4771169.1 putative 2-hydroxychromene-2-carboxylate isomerase [Aureobasidium sp. EXF-3400]